MSDQMEVKSELLVLIEDAVDAMKLITTWPKVWFDYGEEMEAEAPRFLNATDPLAYHWARIGGVDQDDVEHWAPVLFENGLLLEGGVVSDTALGYVKSRGLSILQAAMT